MNRHLRRASVSELVSEILSGLEQAERHESTVCVPWPEDCGGCYAVEEPQSGEFSFSRILPAADGRRMREDLSVWSSSRSNLHSYLYTESSKHSFDAAPSIGQGRWKLFLACAQTTFRSASQGLSEADRQMFEVGWLGPFSEEVPVQAHRFAVREFRLDSRALPNVRNCSIQGPTAVLDGPPNGMLGALQCSLDGITRLHVRGRIWIFLKNDRPIPNFDPRDSPGSRIWSWDTNSRIPCWRIRKPSEVTP